ncbi:MAG: hypothetical protein ILP16_05805 [Spirochaetales bacterium]|nr:hypothetical protein [Spirochaetales bacterium]
MNRLTRYFKDKDFRIHVNTRLGLYDSMSDEAYLKMLFKADMGYDLDLDNPRTFCEKLQWLKLHDRKDVYTVMADKYLSKQFVANKVGKQHVVPLLGVWNKFDDIVFGDLPARFVLKCNHDSGTVIICRDKSALDMRSARSELEESLNSNYYRFNREWPYKNIKPKIIAEEYLQHGSDDYLWDYKFFCFNGEPKIMYMEKEASDVRTEAFFDMDRNYLDLEMDDPRPEKAPELPPCFDEMRGLAASLSEGIPFLRVDFFLVGSKVYVGELTFFHQSGLTPIKPKEWDYKLGEWIRLPEA